MSAVNIMSFNCIPLLAFISLFPSLSITFVIVPFSSVAPNVIYNVVPSAVLLVAAFLPAASVVTFAFVICGFEPANSTFPSLSTVNDFPSIVTVTGNAPPSTCPP